MTRRAKLRIRILAAIFVVIAVADVFLGHQRTRGDFVHALLLYGSIFGGCLVVLVTKGDFQDRLWRLLGFLSLPAVISGYIFVPQDPMMGFSWINPVISLFGLVPLTVAISTLALILEKIVLLLSKQPIDKSAPTAT